MTAYQGGKGRLGKKISKIIQIIEEDLKATNFKYIEPFCGMCGVMYHMASHDCNRVIIANDANADVIQMWRDLQDGWSPPESCSREEFNKLKNEDRDIPIARRGFLGSVSSYGNIFMGYYRLHLQPKHRDYVGEGKKRILELVKNLGEVNFTHGSYEGVEINNSVVYCDPPYIKNGFKTGYFQGFNHERFWEVMREWSSKAIVIISEREAPDDFRCLWSLDTNFSINKQTLTKSKECLFVHKDTFSMLSEKVLRQIEQM